MDNTPREYVRNLEAKWEKNRRAKELLIERIKRYELLDDKYKKQLEQEIVSNFDINEKKELGGELYIVAKKILGEQDNKYGELNRKREELELLEKNKNEILDFLRNVNLSNKDGTTIDIEMVLIEEKKADLNRIKENIKQLELEIKNMEAELAELEKVYGKREKQKKIENNEDEKVNKDGEIYVGKEKKKFKNFKEYGEEETKDLWKKRVKRKEIIDILDQDMGLDESLRNKMKNELMELFNEYYEGKKGDVRKEMSQYLKNRTRNIVKRYNKINSMEEGLEKEKKMKLLEREGKAYFGQDFNLKSYVLEKNNKNELNQGLKVLAETGKDKLQPGMTINLSYNNLGYEGENLLMSVQDEKYKFIVDYRRYLLKQFKTDIINGSGIVNAINQIKSKIKIDDQGNVKVEISFGDIVYDIIYQLNKIEVFQDRIKGNNVENWENKKMAKYVKSWEGKGYHIPSQEEMDVIFEALGKYLINDDSRASKIQILMYLTGMNGSYWLQDGDVCRVLMEMSIYWAVCSIRGGYTEKSTGGIFLIKKKEI